MAADENRPAERVVDESRTNEAAVGKSGRFENAVDESGLFEKTIGEARRFEPDPTEPSSGEVYTNKVRAIAVVVFVKVVDGYIEEGPAPSKNREHCLDVRPDVRNRPLPGLDRYRSPSVRS